ncbi:hypothetical protein [Psychromonas sp. Urea-02u-13]
MTCRANDVSPYYYFQYLFTQSPLCQSFEYLTDLTPCHIVYSEN